VKETDEGSEEKRGKEKKIGKLRQEKSSLVGTFCVGLNVLIVVGLFTLAIRASVVNTHPDRTLIIHNGTIQSSSKQKYF